MPIFIYSFFSQLSLELFRFKTMLKGKEQINHRQVNQLLNEICTAIVKMLIDTILTMIRKRRDESDITWQNGGDTFNVQQNVRMC